MIAVIQLVCFLALLVGAGMIYGWQGVMTVAGITLALSLFGLIGQASKDE